MYLLIFIFIYVFLLFYIFTECCAQIVLDGIMTFYSIVLYAVLYVVNIVLQLYCTLYYIVYQPVLHIWLDSKNGGRSREKQGEAGRTGTGR